jgi:hypothetical protein
MARSAGKYPLHGDVHFQRYDDVSLLLKCTKNFDLLRPSRLIEEMGKE